MRNVTLKITPNLGKFRIISIANAIEVDVAGRDTTKIITRRVGSFITEEEAKAVCANPDYSVKVIA